jgi:hypothetical protein
METIIKISPETRDKPLWYVLQAVLSVTMSDNNT